MPIISLVDTAFNLYSLVIFIRIIMSWIQLPDNAVTGFIYDISEPYLGLFRRLLPVVSLGGAGIDFSPIIALFVLNRLIQPLVIQVLQQAFGLA